MQLDPPFEYYVGAGSVTNTIWNEISGYPYKLFFPIIVNILSVLSIEI